MSARGRDQSVVIFRHGLSKHATQSPIFLHLQRHSTLDFYPSPHHHYPCRLLNETVRPTSANAIKDATEGAAIAAARHEGAAGPSGNGHATEATADASRSSASPLMMGMARASGRRRGRWIVNGTRMMR